MTYEITRGERTDPIKCCVYGTEGVGKTTFASKWPDAVFIDIEDGSGYYDVARYPRPKSWMMLLDEVRHASFDSQVGTLVIDTADAAEQLCIEHVLKTKKWSGIEDAGYGKGYTYLAEEYQKLIDALDECLDAGVNVLVLAHAQIKKFEQPDELGAYDRWELKLQKKTSSLIKEWCSLLLFANYRTEVVVSSDGKKAKAQGGKKRIMYASHDATHDAKNRLGLPDEMPLEFEQIEKFVPHRRGASVAERIGAEAAPEKTEVETEAPKADEQPEQKTVIQGFEFEDVTEPHTKRLQAKMIESGITPAQLRDAVGSRKNNKYTDATPIGAYDEHFVDKVLLAHWDAILETIHERDELYKDVPF